MYAWELHCWELIAWMQAPNCCLFSKTSLTRNLNRVEFQFKFKKIFTWLNSCHEIKRRTEPHHLQDHKDQDLALILLIIAIRAVIGMGFKLIWVGEIWVAMLNNNNATSDLFLFRICSWSKEEEGKRVLKCLMISPSLIRSISETIWPVLGLCCSSQELNGPSLRCSSALLQHSLTPFSSLGVFLDLSLSISLSHFLISQSLMIN